MIGVGLGFLWFNSKLGIKGLSTPLEVSKSVNVSEISSNILRPNEGNNLRNRAIELVESALLVTPKLEESFSDIHVIFSTDCTPFQDWQTLVVFNSAVAVGQLGPITRIASGCIPEKEDELRKLYSKLYPQYHVHFTPDFKHDEKSNKKYDFYNKPFGLLHWLENSAPAISGDVVIALIDPDFVFLRPLTTKVAGEANLIFSSGNKASDIFDRVGKGKAVAQQYGLGAPWARKGGHPKFNRDAICGADSPCLSEKENFAGNHYSVGPPYMVQKDDLHRLAVTWTSFVPRVYEGYPYLLAEMYAYSMAASHEKLPHLQLDHYMVSNTDAGGEGWQWIDQLDNPCSPPENGIYFPNKPLPTFLHYCQFFSVGELGFYKRQFPRDSFSCEAPMLVEPPELLHLTQHRVRGDKVSSPILI